MKLHELPRDRQAQAQPAVLPRGRSVRLTECVEDVGEEASVDPLAGVDDLDAESMVPREADGRRAVSSAELDRVRNQVPHDLLQPVWIAGRDRGADRDLGRQRDVFGRCGGAYDLHRGIDDVREIHRLNLDVQFSCDDPRDLEQIFDETRLRARVALDRFERPFPRGALDVRRP